MAKIQKKYQKPSIKSSKVAPISFYGRGGAQSADSEAYLLTGVIS